jgi:hypothetical protein
MADLFFSRAFVSFLHGQSFDHLGGLPWQKVAPPYPWKILLLRLFSITIFLKMFVIYLMVNFVIFLVAYHGYKVPSPHPCGY